MKQYFYMFFNWNRTETVLSWIKDLHEFPWELIRTEIVQSLSLAGFKKESKKQKPAITSKNVQDLST